MAGRESKRYAPMFEFIRQRKYHFTAEIDIQERQVHRKACQMRLRRFDAGHWPYDGTPEFSQRVAQVSRNQILILDDQNPLSGEHHAFSPIVILPVSGRVMTHLTPP
jgi:hypothetical protein